MASQENWQERLESIETQARENSDQQIQESLEEMTTRHIKTARMLQAKGIEALRSMQIKTVSDALKALQVGLEKERLIRGEPSDRTVVEIEEIIKREYAEWMVDDKEDGDGEGGDDKKPVEERSVP